MTDHPIAPPPELPDDELIGQWSKKASDRGNAKLSDDYTRCMGLMPLCPQRYQCARRRDTPSRRGVASWVRNLNPYGDPQCSYFIPFGQ